MKYFLYIFIILISIFVLLKLNLKQHDFDLPVFLKNDTIASNHQTNINTTVHSFYKPDSNQLKMLVRDYSSIWAHLNYLYSTGDVQKGKEYYTQDWFNVICNEYKLPLQTNVTRVDVAHKLHVVNWSFDGLVCNVIDSNVVIKTFFKHTLIDSSTSHFAVALLFQGDHWRIDAIKQINN